VPRLVHKAKLSKSDTQGPSLTIRGTAPRCHSASACAGSSNKTEQNWIPARPLSILPLLLVSFLHPSFELPEETYIKQSLFNLQQYIMSITPREPTHEPDTRPPMVPVSPAQELHAAIQRAWQREPPEEKIRWILRDLSERIRFERPANRWDSPPTSCY
jgi:hypothetical protein